MCTTEEAYCQHRALDTETRISLAAELLRKLHRKWPRLCPCSDFDVLRVNRYFRKHISLAIAEVPLDWEPPRSLYKGSRSHDIIIRTRSAGASGLPCEDACQLPLSGYDWGPVFMECYLKSADIHNRRSYLTSTDMYTVCQEEMLSLEVYSDYEEEPRDGRPEILLRDREEHCRVNLATKATQPLSITCTWASVSLLFNIFLILLVGLQAWCFILDMKTFSISRSG
jgi:hypothetical protein